MSTRVGYAGGTTNNPSYYNLGDHTETIEINYDPNIISYRELLNIFWNLHNPIYETGNRQYMSIIFYHNDIQMEEAIDVKRQIEAERGQKIYTEIVAFKNFYLAEGYHQKYYLQNATKPYKELKNIYSSFSEFVSSTLTARVNGYIAGSISISSLKEELEYLEVPEENYDRLIAILEDLR
ncbi:peptide-methionine (S)-S-oxide reductase [Alkaliphilus sp. B6464]|uniref:peptide-methionine (S)-S-oxide reductase n=1 Tax=Alkaliphilus sp. B6464 TaxID=2731219 RepID=UPI0020129BE2|nr:peptide-methionine (S)-S-oxide reductase [Alkaliphilus sp. B6464]